jgi:hypothetical protein
VRRGPRGRALEVIERPGKVGRFGDRRALNENLQDALLVYTIDSEFSEGELNQCCSSSVSESFKGLDNTIRAMFFSGDRKEQP